MTHPLGAARNGSETLIGQSGSWPRPRAAEGLVARTPGKETLPFRSYGIPGEWRQGLSPPGGRAGPGLRLVAGGSRACAGNWVGTSVSRLSPTRRSGVGMSRYLPGRGRRETWNERHRVSKEVPGPGTLRGSEQNWESARDGRSRCAGRGHVEDPQRYSRGRGKRRGS